MPNFTFCSLSIEGDKKDLERFYKENCSEESHLDFSKSAPLEGKYDAPDKWGTKWNAIECDQEYQNNLDESAILHYQFQTAWDEPFAWFETVAEKYPELTFSLHFEEEAWLHCGLHEASGGCVEYNKYVYGDPEFETMYRNSTSDEEWEEFVAEREQEE